MKGITVGKEYESNNFGKFTISYIVSHRCIGITFIDTGYSYETQAGSIRSGKLKDRTSEILVEVGNHYKSKRCGTFEVVSITGGVYTVRFLNTGSLVKVTKHDILRKEVRDKYAPVVCGLGFTPEPVKDYSLKAVWSGMMHRCYDKGNKEYGNYGGAGVVVHPKWFNYNTFECWCLEQEIKAGWQIDKDIFAKGCLYYSPETCVFVPNSINALFRRRKNKTGLPQGITPSKSGSGYIARTVGQFSGKTFKCLEKAKAHFASNKTHYVRFVAKREFDKGNLTERVYLKLKNFVYTHS